MSLPPMTLPKKVKALPLSPPQMVKASQQEFLEHCHQFPSITKFKSLVESCYIPPSEIKSPNSLYTHVYMHVQQKSGHCLCVWFLMSGNFWLYIYIQFFFFFTSPCSLVYGPVILSPTTRDIRYSVHRQGEVTLVLAPGSGNAEKLWVLIILCRG